MLDFSHPPAKSTIEVYFDIISPFSWFAFTVSQYYAQLWRSHGYAVTYVPVYQAGIMAGSRNSPPMTVPAKGRMSSLDAQRWSRLLDMKVGTPAVFPVNSIHCARLLAVVARYHAGKLETVMRVLWTGYWGGTEGLDISNPEDLQRMLSRVFTGSEVEMMMVMSRNEHFKHTVRENTRQAVEDGAFGVPWIKVIKENGESECFFGNDRWIHVVRYAGLPWHGYAVVGGGQQSCI